MSRKTSITSGVAVESPVTHEQANVSGGRLGSAEQPVCVLTGTQYGRIGLTLDSEFSTDAQGRTRSAYWLRFEKPFALTQALIDAGWHTPKTDRRKGFWAFVGEKSEQSLIGMGVPDALLPKRTPKAATVKTAPAKPVTPAKTSTPTSKASAPTQESAPVLSHLSDKALATLLEQVSAEIARRSRA